MPSLVEVLKLVEVLQLVADVDALFSFDHFGVDLL